MVFYSPPLEKKKKKYSFKTIVHTRVYAHCYNIRKSIAIGVTPPELGYLIVGTLGSERHECEPILALTNCHDISTAGSISNANNFSKKKKSIFKKFPVQNRTNIEISTVESRRSAPGG